MTYGYLFNAQYIEYDKIKKEMQEKYGCTEFFSDAEKDEKKRPAWIEMTKKMQNGDTLVIYSLDNILLTVTALPFFLRWLTLKEICLVSIKDEIDTECNFFCQKSTREIFDIIGLLPQKIGKNKRKGFSRKVTAFLPCNNKEDAKKSVAIKIVNMYRSGYSVSEIAETVGYKTRMSVYNVLSRFNIDLRQNRQTGQKRTEDKEVSSRAQIACEMLQSGVSITEIVKLYGFSSEEEAKQEIREYQLRTMK